MLNKVSMAWAGLLNMGCSVMPRCYRMPELAPTPANRAQAATETVAGGVSNV